jgi:hypothetical protein
MARMICPSVQLPRPVSESGVMLEGTTTPGIPLLASKTSPPLPSVPGFTGPVSRLQSRAE